MADDRWFLNAAYLHGSKRHKVSANEWKNKEDYFPLNKKKRMTLQRLPSSQVYRLFGLFLENAPVVEVGFLVVELPSVVNFFPPMAIESARTYSDFTGIVFGIHRIPFAVGNVS